MKTKRDKIYRIMFLFCMVFYWLALNSDDYGDATRDGFAVYRYCTSVVFVVIATLVSHSTALGRCHKLRKIVNLYWGNACVIAVLAVFFIETLDKVTLSYIIVAPLMLFTPFLVIHPVFYLVASRWTEWNWVQILDYNILFTCCFSALQLAVIHRMKLHQCYLNLPIYRRNR